MRCNHCGGELIFRDNLGTCYHCGNTQTLESAFENTDVCICYLEYDSNGRRTKDSMIAGEIYKQLESKKISTFYERISGGTAAGSDLEALRYNAMFHSKVILLVGTSAENFSVLQEKYTTGFRGKRVIPVISGLKPEQLPSELRSLQASNFDTIGALNDLSVSVRNILGRSQEVALEEVHNKHQKRIRILAAILIPLLIVGVFAAVLAFTLPLLQKDNTNIDDTQPVLTNNDIYSNAVSLMEAEKYLEAAEQFSQIDGFKDSSAQLKKIYDRYDGYYQTESLDFTLYINVHNANTVSATIEHLVAGSRRVSLEVENQLEGNKFQAVYIDSQGNAGTVTLILSNDRILLTTTTVGDSELSMGNTQMEFLLSQRTDKPLHKEITAEDLRSWLTQRTFLSDLKQSGIELEFARETVAGGGTNIHAVVYTIANTDIQLMLMDFDLTKTHNYDEIEENLLDDYYVVGLIAPAALLCESKIGQTAKLYLEGDILYAINVASFRLTITVDNSPEYCVAFFGDATDFRVNADTLVGAVSNQALGDFNFQYFLQNEERFYPVSSGSELPPSDDMPTPPADTGSDNDLPYLTLVSAGTQVYSGPGFDYAVVMTIEEAGTYTIIDESQGSDGSIWGQLKSGAGWIVVSESDAY